MFGADPIDLFLGASCFAVVGASNDMNKYGAKIFAAYRQKQLTVYPINPKESEIQGVPAYKSLADLPEPCPSVSVITPPAVTEKVVAEAIAAGVEHIWLQPGAESQAAIEAAEAAGLNVIHSGPCILVKFATG